MKIVTLNDVRTWFEETGDLAEFSRTIGQHDPEAEERTAHRAADPLCNM